MSNTIKQHLLIIWLGAGSIFSWYTVFSEFYRYRSMTGSWLPISGSILPHPTDTACFYGAIAFGVALCWSIYLSTASSSSEAYRHLTYFLFGCVLFALYNFIPLLYQYCTSGGNAQIGCGGALVANPLTTPCFFGLVFFITSFLLSRRK